MQKEVLSAGKLHPAFSYSHEDGRRGVIDTAAGYMAAMSEDEGGTPMLRIWMGWGYRWWAVEYRRLQSGS
jgi:hypothetical protein